jgi:hypothetical protein
MGKEMLTGLYREVFAAAVAASGPVNGVELTRAVSREVEIKNEVEKIRHRAMCWRSGAGWCGRRTDGSCLSVVVGAAFVVTVEAA